jgi:phenylpropionate dioxygenase-like ring-hydroxylating dioxygenase large terminal subunit
MAVFSDNPVLRGYWHAVARVSEVPSGPLKRTLLNQDVVIWRTPDGSVAAGPDRCPHREAPLSEGWCSTDGVLVCPYHGWEFGDGGELVRVPSALPGVPVPPTGHLPVYRCQERYGLVWVCLDEPVADIPSIGQDDDPTFRRINNPVEAWTCSATRLTDNFMDITHFPFVHTGSFGRAQDTIVPRYEVGPLDDGWTGYAYEVDVNNPASAQTISGQQDKVLHRRMSSGFALPVSVRSTIHYETGLEHILLLLTTPIDDVNCYFTFVVWRNDDFSVSAEEVIAFDRMIGAEDKVMLEKIPGVLPLTQTGVVSVQSDKGNVEWRRQLAELLGLR